MERTLFAFIWKHSKVQQFMLLGVTLVTFPFLFASLELPKRIVNDAISSDSAIIDLWNYELTQVEYLLVLCVLFLGAVLVSGLLKMRLNTMKGIVAERLLRRLRFQLISRMTRFPKSYFRQTSQGELVSMVTAEAEPMGGLMGDALAQPVFQAGQMITIVMFLFLQSLWFGLAAVALIPLQAWLIPKLQRQINQLNKKRIVQIRHLAAEIGETAAGISDLRVNGGLRLRLAEFSKRLGKLFDIRFQIYQKKFFMKFLNNFITQLTPFFFYSIGGYLAIKGEITVGALVAALAAYKDLSSPWKELLTYYNQVQDMSLRWEIVTERFAPRRMTPDDRFDNPPEDIPHIDGDIHIKDVTVRDDDGNTVLEDITLHIPRGARVAIKTGNAAERSAIAELLTRETCPIRGSVTIAGEPLTDMHQSVLAARIGYAHSNPYLFDGTLGDNLMMPLRSRPGTYIDPNGKPPRWYREALRSGNSGDATDAEWLRPDIAGLESGEDVRGWWFKLVETMGIDEGMFRRALRSRIDPEIHRNTAQRVVDLRPVLWERLQKAGLDKHVYRFDPDAFNPTIPIGGNLLFAAPTREIPQQSLVSDGKFIQILHDHNVAAPALEISHGVVELLRQTFGEDGTAHPLFLRLGIEPEVFARLSAIAARRTEGGDAALSDVDRSTMITVAFLLSAEQIGEGFPDAFKARIVEIRKSRARQLRKIVKDMFVEIKPDTYFPRLTVAENALYGRVSMFAGADADKIENLISEVMEEYGVRRYVASTIYDMPSGIAGSKLPSVLQERAGFSRAAIKRPDVLILDKVLASHEPAKRQTMRDNLRKLLPDTTMIFLEDNFIRPAEYDLYVEISKGRIVGREQDETAVGSAETVSEDMRVKLDFIARTPMFRDLDIRNQRLLAFSARRVTVSPGQDVFRAGDPPDAVYLCVDGEAELHWPDNKPGDAPIAVVQPGRLMGDLSVLLGKPREAHLIATKETVFLRIGGEEYLAVIEGDLDAALKLLRAVAGNLANTAKFIQKNNAIIQDIQVDEIAPRSDGFDDGQG